MIYDSKKKFQNTLYLCTNIHQDVMNFLGDRMLRNIKKVDISRTGNDFSTYYIFENVSFFSEGNL